MFYKFAYLKNAMKRIFALGVASLCCLFIIAQEKSLSVTVKNNWDEPKKDEPVVIKFKILKDWKNLSMKVKSVIVWDGDKEIPSQLDDLNRDGVNDELAFVIDVPSKSSKTLRISLSSKTTTTVYPARVHAQMKLSDKNKKNPEIQYLSVPGGTPDADIYSAIYGHGPCFESELTAFRIYFDNRQSIDLYGKIKRQLELAETNFYTPKEQRDKGYGCDVLWAGKSVSLGSFRGWENNEPSYINKVALRSEGILAYGPVRTVIEVADKDWEYNGKKLNMIQRYILYAGHRDVEVNIHFEEADVKNNTFCTGVMKLETENKGFIQKDGLAGSWGKNIPEKGEPDNVETVGLGVYIPQVYVSKTLEDSNNYLILLNTNGKKSLKYNLTFCAAKEEQGFKDSKSWFEYLNQWKNQLQHICSISIK